jgi:hypothetical protein
LEDYLGVGDVMVIDSRTPPPFFIFEAHFKKNFLGEIGIFPETPSVIEAVEL